MFYECLVHLDSIDLTEISHCSRMFYCTDLFHIKQTIAAITGSVCLKHENYLPGMLHKDLEEDLQKNKNKNIIEVETTRTVKEIAIIVHEPVIKK